MKLFRNEKGYTLLLTLIIVFVIIIFFSSFVLSAMNQQKQVDKTDDTYEATALAEMGVEYYQASLLSLIEKYRIKFEEEVELNNRKKEKDRETIEEINARIFPYLISEVKNLPKTKEIESTNKFFGTSQAIGFSGNNLNPIEVYGQIKKTKKIKTITAIFNFPTSLISIASIGNNNNNNNGNNKGVYYTLLEPPVFPNTAKPSNINLCPSVDSITGSNNTEFICHSSSLNKLGNILNLNLYYTGPYELQNLNENFKGLNNFYANSGVKIGNLKPKLNSSFYINGETIIDTIDKPTNTTIYSMGNIEINSLNNMEKLNIYSTKKINFKNAIQAKNLTLDAQEVTFNNLNNNNANIILQVAGNATFKEINTISNSNFIINGTAIFQSQNTGSITGNSILLLDSISFTSQNNNILKLEDTSKICIRNANYETIKHSINTTAHSELIILVNNPKDVKNTGHVDLVLEKDFNKRCNSSSIENEQPPTNDNFIKDIIYN